MRARFDSAAIASATGGEVIRAGGSGPITANNRTCASGEWFVALAGEGFDDHTFVPEAVERGVAGVVVERPIDADCGVVQVSDTWQALRDLARVARRGFSGPVVAVTGSMGKTTTRVLTAAALSARGDVHQNQGNSNDDPGVALTLLEVSDSAWAQVVEMGTYIPGRIAHHTTITEPDVRVVTHIGPAHLGGLGDLDGVAREKGVLLDTASPGDIAIVNLDDPRVAALPIPAAVRRVGVGQGGEVALLSAELNAESLTTTARWRTPDGAVTAILRSPAEFVARNAAIALGVAWALGVDVRQAASALEGWAPRPGRMCPVRLANGATVLDDTFNANPESVSAALDLLARLPGRRVAVLGDMAELGAESDAYHRQVVRHAAGLELHQVLLVGPQLASAAGVAPVTAVGAAEALRPWLRSGDHVLVKGSRVMGLEAVVDRLADR